MTTMIMNTTVQHVLPIFVGLLAKSTLLLLLAALACRLLRRSSAATRHLVWTAAVISVLLLPLISAALPKWNVAWGHTAATSPAAPPAVLDLGTVKSAPQSVVATSDFASSVPTRADAVPASAADATEIPTPVSHRRIPAVTAWGTFGLTLWLGGTLVSLAYLAVGLSRIGRIRQRAIPLEGGAFQIAEAARQQIGLRRRVLFLRADARSAVVVPVTWGVLRPVVLLPMQSAAWSEECLRAAFLHELAHVQRFDWPTQLLARLACALYWWHPLVWWATRQARAESETACDDLVLETGMKATDYAQRLIEVVRSMPTGKTARTLAVTMAQSSEVEGRVKAVLATGRNRSHLSQRRLVLTGMMLGFLLLPLSMLRPVLRAAAADGQINNAVSVPITPGYQKLLPNGYTVGVEGVTRVTAVGNGKGMFSDPFWGPDGTLLTSPLAKTDRYPKRFGWESTPTHPLFALDLRFIHPGATVPTSNISTYYHITSADSHITFLSGQPFLRFNTRKWAESVVLPVASPSGARTCSLHLGIAVGQWQTVATLPVRLTPQTGQVSIHLGDKPSVVYQTQYPGRIERTDSFLGTSEQLGNVARRAVIVDASGREILLQEGRGDRGTVIDNLACRNGTLSMDYPKTTLPHVEAILLQTRPYQMAEFRNIQLHAKAVVSGVGGPLGWVILPTATTVMPFTCEDRPGGKLLKSLRAQGGYDQPTQTLRQVTLTQYKNGRVSQTIRSDDAQLLGSTLTFHNVSLNVYGPNGQMKSETHCKTLVWRSAVALYLVSSENLSAGRAVPNFNGHPVVVVDPGHGGLDTGAVGAGGVMEKTLNLQIAQQLRADLERRGAVVFLTRDSDTYLPILGRPQFATQHHADYFVSLHCDVWAKRSDQVPQKSEVTGTLVYFHGQNPKQHRLAQSIGFGIGQATALPPSKVTSDAARFVAGFGVLREAQMPAVLVECGYINTPQGLSRLQDPRQQQRLAEGIAAGLVAAQVQD